MGRAILRTSPLGERVASAVAAVEDLEAGSLPPVCAKTGEAADGLARIEFTSTPGWTWILLLFGILCTATSHLRCGKGQFQATRDRTDGLVARRIGVLAPFRAFGLKPHLAETFKLSPDPQFIDKVRDIVGLYLNPPDAAVVLCVDETSQIQALDRTAPVLPLLPGTPERRTHDYRRNGITNLYGSSSITQRGLLGRPQIASPIGPQRIVHLARDPRSILVA